MEDRQLAFIENLPYIKHCVKLFNLIHICFYLPWELDFCHIHFIDEETDVEGD